MSLITIKSKIKGVDIRIGSKPSKRITGRALMRIRDRILIRDCYTCQVCGRVDHGPGLDVDHIVRLESGGKESDDNRQTLCVDCHREKTNLETANRFCSD